MDLTPEGLSSTFACSVCGTPSADGDRFCSQCGRLLHPRQGELRYVTVFFCDLVGSSGLASRLKAERYGRVIHAYRTACEEVAIAHGGHVGPKPGDGVVGYFGFPLAHEDDAARAVRSCLAIVSRIGAISPEGERLRVRIGIHTGTVTVGDPDQPRRSDDILGEIPNEAESLQSHADAGTVLISSATAALVAGQFELEDRGLVALKSGPLHAFRVLRERKVASRFDAIAQRGLTPLTGRIDQAELVRRLWRSARGGRREALLVCGEPGIGKSRLLGVARDAARDDGCDVIVAQCAEHLRNTPFHPIAEVLSRRLDPAAQLGPTERLHALEEYVAELGLPMDTAVPLLAPLLAVRVDDTVALRSLTPARRIQESHDLLSRLLRQMAGGEPMLILFEDLHWADPSTLDFITTVLSRETTEGVMIAMSTRSPSDALPEIARRSTIVELGPLDGLEVRALVSGILQGRRLPEEVVHDIIARAGGVPLFVEAVTRTILESGYLRLGERGYELSEPLPAHLIPATVHGSLLARIDALGEGHARKIAQLAATFGRDFSVEMLRAVSVFTEAQIEEALARMMGLNLVCASATTGRFNFTHALIQDAAYESLLTETRRAYHAAIATYLAEREPEVLQSAPELLARHLEGAGEISRAVDQWMVAGTQAGERSAVRECVGYLRKVVDLLDDLPPGDPERRRKEMRAQLALAPALMVTHGWASREVERACLRARELSEEAGYGQGVAASLWGLWTVRFVRGELDAALESARAVLSMARAAGDPLLLVAACHGMAFTHYFRGEFAEARLFAEEGLEHFDLERERLLLRLFQIPSSVCCMLVLAQCLRFTGFPDTAARRHREMLNLVTTLDNPACWIVGLGIGMYYDFDRRDRRAIAEQSARGYQLALEEGFQLWVGGMQVYHGWATSLGGDPDAGIPEIRSGFADFAHSESELTLSAMHLMLAEALLASHRGADALVALETARSYAERLNERYFEAEIHRLTGEILFDRGSAGEGEAHLRQAIDTARRQGARLLELRAGISLGERLLKCGRGREVPALIEPLRSTFTEGHEETELRESARLLARCGPGPR